VKLSAAGEPHLTYCTNIHAGESWAEIKQNLERFLPAVKQRLAPDRPFGVGLRLSGRAAEELSAPGELPALKDFLARSGLYVFTINGFPYGTFHGARVKEDVYLPDWLDDERLVYSDRLAAILAELLPASDGLEGTVSTVPGAFKPRVDGDRDVASMADRMIRLAASLHRLRERTGKVIALALEPEPFCHLETVAETVSFFEERLFSSVATSRLAALAGVGRSESEAILRRHLGVCFDACHMAVGFEDVRGALAALEGAGIGIGKFQISAGLEVSPEQPAEETARALGPFAEGVYLHQVTERRADGLRRYLDLPDALAAAARSGRLAGTWRIHFHVPLFRERLDPFKSTQGYLEELLGVLRTSPHSKHLEVETYTWDVLPEEFRREDIVDAIARELRWVEARMQGPPPPVER